MRPKKAPKADLKRSRFVFFEIGMIAVIVAVIAIFTVRGKENNVGDWIVFDPFDGAPTETVPTTKHEELKDKVIPRHVITDVFNKVSNDKVIITPVDFYWYEGDGDPVILPELGNTDEKIDEFELLSDKMPSFEGGDISVFKNWVIKRFRYPDAALSAGMEGKVVVEFIIEKDGTLNCINVVQSTDPVFSDEVKRVVAMSPKWEPGFNGITPVRIKYFMPIEFKIEK